MCVHFLRALGETNVKAALRIDWPSSDHFSKCTGFRPFFLTPEIDKQPRLFRENRSLAVVPDNVIGPFA
jgi:hypothetical protein